VGAPGGSAIPAAGLALARGVLREVDHPLGLPSLLAWRAGYQAARAAAPGTPTAPAARADRPPRRLPGVRR